MKVENTPTHHRREYNASGTSQASFLAKFKATNNKLGQKRHRHSGVPKTLCNLRYTYRLQIKKTIKHFPIKNSNPKKPPKKTNTQTKKNKQNNKTKKHIFILCLEGKKIETVGLYPTFLAQEITRDK